MTNLVEDTGIAAKIKETANEIEAARARLKSQSQELLKESFQKIFETYPTVAKIAWTQYTPYFNDGDECVFGVNDWEIFSTEEVEDENSSLNSDYDGGYSYGDAEGHFSTWGDENKVTKYLWKSKDGWTTGTEPRYRQENYTREENPNYDPAYGEPYEAINDLQRAIDEPSMKEIFGDHVLVEVTKDGIEVTEYSHD